MQFIEPGQTALRDFLAQFPAGKPVVMLKLLKFRAEANYLPGQDGKSVPVLRPSCAMVRRSRH